MDELVKRLKDASKMSEALAVLLPNSEGNATAKLYNESADAIEKLRKQVELEHQSGFADGQIAANRKKPRWIPVTERLPKYGERVLVFGGVTMYVAYYDKNRYGGESWHKLNSKSHYCNPTHWMPLPEPPKDG